MITKSPYWYLTSLAGFTAALLLASSADAALLTVTSAADAGGSCPGPSCTLRQAIATAEFLDTINFDAGITTIDLTSGELLIDNSLTISGPGPNLLTVQRSSALGTLEFHIFHVVPNVGVTISGLAIRNGDTPSGNNGGAIFNAGTLIITACTISDNLSDGGGIGGGAIFNNGGDPGATLTINNSTISGNSTLGGLGGGGIMDGGGRVTINNSTVSGNSSGDTSGGGIYTLGTMTIINSTVSGNSAGNSTGGGIYTFGALNLTNTTVSGNSAGDGGGIKARPSGTLFKSSSSIIAKNTAVVGPDVSGAMSSLGGYNLIGNSSGVTINAINTGNQLDVDPLLGPLQDNGGPTRTHALLPGSPAIDKGHSRGSVTDQRDFPRPVGTATVTGGNGSDIGAFEVQIATGPPGTLGNISTRLRVLSGDNALIGGMIATGTAPKRVILRAIGPTLTDLGVPGALTDTTLELYQGNTLLLSNDDWRISSQEAEIEASGFAPNKNVESAIIWTLTPGQGYTAIVRGKNGETGIGVVEAFDLDHGAASKLGNISTRGFVEMGDNVMIAGLIVTPNNGTNARILVRALGPTLTDLGVPGALANPTLDLVNSSGTVVRSNNDWNDDPLQRSAIDAAGLAPNHDEEAALVQTVAPGAYTAIVRGIGATPTGVALVEVYHLL